MNHSKREYFFGAIQDVNENVTFVRRILPVFIVGIAIICYRAQTIGFSSCIRSDRVCCRRCCLCSSRTGSQNTCYHRCWYGICRRSRCNFQIIIIGVGGKIVENVMIISLLIHIQHIRRRILVDLITEFVPNRQWQIVVGDMDCCG